MSIRAKLLLSYALVVLLTLGLATLIGVVVLQRYQHTFSLSRLANIAEPVALILHDRAFADSTTFDVNALLAKEAEQTQTRMILVEVRFKDIAAARRGAGIDTAVQFDSAGALEPGARVRVPRPVVESWLVLLETRAQRGATPPSTPLPPVNARLVLPKPYQRSFTLDGGTSIDMAAIPLRAERRGAGLTFRVLVVAERVGPTIAPLARLTPPLGWAAAGALFASVLLSVALARSVTRPLEHLKQATQAIAAGDFSKRVPTHGGDEVAQLATSFNAMADVIARARRRERDFLANISHDLRTPLTSIQGFAGSLVDGACPPERYPEVARIIHDEANRMGALVDDVLLLSRLEAGEMPLLAAPMEVGGFLAAGARRFAAAATEAGVTLVAAPPATPLVVEVDRARLEQALGNLIENALRFTLPGGRIELEGAPDTLHGRAAARIEVRDTGRGIGADDLPRVFERFYQGDKARTPSRRGSGLGLAIVKELVERHGGEVNAESAPGSGTTIVMRLPLTRSERPGP